MNEMLEKLVYHPFHHICSLNFTASPLCVRTKSSLFSLASNVSTKASETLCLWEWNYTLQLYQQDFDAFGTFHMLFLLWLGRLTFLISLINSDLSFKALWKVHIYYETFLMKCSPICESLSFLHESCPSYIFAYCMSQTVVYHLLNCPPYWTVGPFRMGIMSVLLVTLPAPCVPQLGRVMPVAESMSKNFTELNLEDRNTNPGKSTGELAWTLKYTLLPFSDIINTWYLKNVILVGVILVLQTKCLCPPKDHMLKP